MVEEVIIMLVLEKWRRAFSCFRFFVRIMKEVMYLEFNMPSRSRTNDFGTMGGFWP